MDEKSKLLVFDKKEVFLIFLFMILIAVTSFALGVKIGRNFSLRESGITSSDISKIEMKSTKEEQVQEVLNKQQEDKSQVELNDLNQKLKDEFEKLDQQEVNNKPAAVETTQSELSKELEQTVTESETAKDPQQTVVAKDSFVGKFTIQLGSHKSLDEAKAFADGFRIRGYNPIINEVSIESKGTWYRVSLGIFNSVAEAKDYVQKEESLFQGQDFVIAKFE